MTTNIKSQALVAILMAMLLFPIALFSQPNIQVNANELNFGDLPFSTSYTASISISNVGDEFLEVSDIIFSSSDFVVSQQSLVVAPFGQEDLEVIFTPPGVGTFEETVTIFSNDPENSAVEAAIFANVFLPQPDYLSASVSESDVTLSWGTSGDEGQWLNYDTGELQSAVGIAEPGIYHIASRWPANDLIAGNQITRFAFFPTGEFHLYTAKIWKGDEAAELVYSEAIFHVEAMQWNEILLDVPVTIEADEEYWFGLEINQVLASDFGAAFDNGPAAEGFGDMINLGGDWVSITTQYGYDNNWLIRALSQDLGESLTEAIAYPNETAFAGQDVEMVKSPVNFSGNQSVFAPESVTEILGYNLYRDGEKLNEDPLNVALFNDTGLAAGVYNYAVTAVYPEGESEPVDRTVQIDAPALTISPVIINGLLQGGEILNTVISLVNTGTSALTWQIDDLPSWMSVSVSGATIEAGGTFNVTLTINSSGLTNGSHNSFVKFNTNNFNKPVTTLPVLVTVEGQLPASFDVDELDFGMVQVFESRIEEVNVTNQTDALLMFLSFETATSNYTAYPSTWAIQPGESLSVLVVFEPSSIDTFLDTLYVEHFGYLGSGVVKLPVTGQGIALPPSNLTSSIDETSITLDWLAPGASPDVLRYGSGEPFSTIGTSVGTYEYAARFTPSDLLPYSGKQLEKVGFFPHQTNADFSLKVYSGENAEVELINLPIANVTADEWNDIELPFPIVLDQVDYLWIGYQTEQVEMTFLAGIDGGPGVKGSGDLIRVNGNDWMTLGDNGWSHNWNIRGLLSDDEGESLMKTGGVENELLLGYNIYRDGEKRNTELLSETTYTDEIVEGENYLYGVTAVYEFGESAPAEAAIAAPLSLVMPQGWEFSTTTRAHNIQIPLEAFQPGLDLQAGDMIGVFYTDNGVEKCAGAIAWNNGNAMLTAFGNDPESPLKTGFDQDEPIAWKVFFSQSQTAYPLEVTYSEEMPHYDGTFKMMGLSMLQTIEMGTVSVDEITPMREMSLYPNPSTGMVTIEGTQSNDLVTVFDTNGRIVLAEKATDNSTQINISQRGLFFVEVKNIQKVTRTKLIIR